MSKEELIMQCPNFHEPVIDEEKSNENWKVYISPCPECGEELVPTLVIKVEGKR